MVRSFFDFVAKKDEEIVRSWMDVVKGWGVNGRGQPGDGGFGYGKFTLITEGKDSSYAQQNLRCYGEAYVKVGVAFHCSRSLAANFLLYF